MDKETIIKGCENWVNNHKDETLPLAYSSVVELLAVLKEQEDQIKNRDESLEKTREEIKWLRGMLKEQETIDPINSYGTFRCRNCGHIVGYNDGQGCGYQNNFCSRCGKAVKWDNAIMLEEKE